MSASDFVLQSVGSLINPEDIQKILSLQENMLDKFEKTNEMLRTVSELSVQRYKVLSSELSNHTQKMISLKKELEAIFKRIRVIKNAFAVKYPNEMSQLTRHLSDPDANDDNFSAGPSTPHETDSVFNKKMETVSEELPPE
ncbi:unnamed protein product [Calicophoron daubneyi]|uniref:KxDL domain-containing protein n=1 Tax=Calicophoron daubneyi TaxID=300641 RepID=A0AAV2TD16_CALDB